MSLLIDWRWFRSKLQLKPESAIDPELATISQLHLSRLASIPIEQLDDDRVNTFTALGQAVGTALR